MTRCSVIHRSLAALSSTGSPKQIKANMEEPRQDLAGIKYKETLHTLGIVFPMSIMHS